MKHQDQRNIETLESRMLECSQEQRYDNCTTRSYRPPQVSLVGKAKRLMAGRSNGNYADCSGQFYFC
jgi:hypothetical protein